MLKKILNFEKKVLNLCFIQFYLFFALNFYYVGYINTPSLNKPISQIWKNKNKKIQTEYILCFVNVIMFYIFFLLAEFVQTKIKKVSIFLSTCSENLFQKFYSSRILKDSVSNEINYTPVQFCLKFNLDNPSPSKRRSSGSPC